MIRSQYLSKWVKIRAEILAQNLLIIHTKKLINFVKFGGKHYETEKQKIQFP